MTLRPTKLRRRLAIEWAGVALVASLVVATLLYWNSLSGVNNLLYDRLSDMDRPVPAEDIMIVEVDEDSLQRFGKWPWSRDVHAVLFDKLAEAQPKVVAFDILLSEASSLPVDEQLAVAISKNENIILPLHFVVPGQEGAAFDVKQPIQPFVDAASDLGHVNLQFDRDGVVRRTGLCFSGGGENSWPHLMEQVYRTIESGPSPAYEKLADCGQSLLLPYAGRGTFSSISHAAIVNDEVPPAFLTDKIILVGATAQGLGDQHPVPLGDGGTLAGVEIMANILSAIRSDNFIAPMSFWQQLVVSLTPLWVLLIGFWRLRPRTTIFVAIGLIITVLLASVALLSFEIWFPPAAALVGLGLVYPIWGWRRLQATSDFMDHELKIFGESKVEIPVVPATPGPVDIVTGQAEALTHAISHVRDLRRFIADALQNLPDPMFITDLDEQVIFVNKLARTGIEDGVNDLALDDMLSRFVAPADLDDVKKYLEQEKQPKAHDYVDFQSLNDEIFAMRRATFLSDEGELRGHIHYLADITEVANAAQEREEVLELLSHDMRAPQAAILALLDAGGSEDSRGRIAGHARRTLALADNFVGLARIKSNEFSGEDILLSELVAEASDSLWPLANARDIKSVIDDQSDGVFVLGEPSSLHRSFVNLIDNAIKYSPDGSTISIDIREISLDKIPHISVAISDEGEGISDTVLNNLFERFASDDGAAHGFVKGTGLGLNFVAAVMERHGGSIRGENPRGGGACFTVLLPQAPEPEIDAVME